MTEHERDQLAEAIAGKLHGTTCHMGWKPEDAATLAGFADTLRQAKAAVVVGVAGGVVVVAFGLLGGGLWLWTHRAAASPTPVPVSALVQPAGESTAN